MRPNSQRTGESSLVQTICSSVLQNSQKANCPQSDINVEDSERKCGEDGIVMLHLVTNGILA